jgi:fatty acid synthase subunit alpha
MTFSSAASPPSIMRSLRVASPSWTVPIPISPSLWSLVNRCDPAKGKIYATAKKLGQELSNNCRGVVSQPSLYKMVRCISGVCIKFHKSTSYFPTARHTEITEKGEIIYSEVNRENVRKLDAYVEEMVSADQISGSVNIQKIQGDVVKLWDIVKSQREICEEQKNRIKA